MKTEDDYIDILSLVTHDLKSPMTAIMASFELLSYDDLSQKEKDDAIKYGKKASKNMLKLIENILIMAKAEAGKEKVSFERVENLDDRFLEIIKTFRFERKLKNIDLKLSIKKPLPDVYWDIDKIHYHVLNNIISNALKFTDSGGIIKVKIYSENNMVYIHIKDDGIGIEEDKQKSVFNKFCTSDNKKVMKGHGLGLSNAYNFVKKHKGDILLTKGINGKGVGFLISLPITPQL